MEEHQCSDLKSSQPQHPTFDISVPSFFCAESSDAQAHQPRVAFQTLPVDCHLETLSCQDSSFAVLLRIDKELETGFVCNVGV